MNETDKVIAELNWFRTVLQKGGKIAEYYEAQSDILTKAIKLLDKSERQIGLETILKVITDLIGKTEPYGDSRIDELRSENLDKLIYVVDNLLCAVADTSTGKDRSEASMQKIGNKAWRALDTWRDWLNEYLRGDEE